MNNAERIEFAAWEYMHLKGFEFVGEYDASKFRYVFRDGDEIVLVAALNQHESNPPRDVFERDLVKVLPMLDSGTCMIRGDTIKALAVYEDGGVLVKHHANAYAKE
jgi:hypothetical protein